MNIPEGYVLLPIKPSSEMIQDICEATGECECLGMCYGDCHCSNSPDIYKAIMKHAIKPTQEDV